MFSKLSLLGCTDNDRLVVVVVAVGFSTLAIPRFWLQDMNPSTLLIDFRAEVVL
jgi:hypothetical protein